MIDLIAALALVGSVFVLLSEHLHECHPHRDRINNTAALVMIVAVAVILARAPVH